MKIAVCYPGTEDIIAKDLNGKKLLDGRVAFEKGSKFGGVRRVYSLIAQLQFKDYDDLISKLSKIKIEFTGSFRVNCNREGNHDFDSQTLAVAVGSIMYERGFAVDLKKPDNIIYLDIIDNDCLVGLLEKDNLCKRDYRIRLVAQSLNACVAYCIAKILGKGDLIDPFCKDGVIAIEAARLKLGKVYADDPNLNNLKHIKTNSEVADVEVKIIKFSDLKERINIATFLPGVFSRTRLNEQLIENFFKTANKIGKKIAVCTFNPEITKKYCKLKLESERKISVGENDYYLISWVSDL